MQILLPDKLCSSPVHQLASELSVSPAPSACSQWKRTHWRCWRTSSWWGWALVEECQRVPWKCSPIGHRPKGGREGGERERERADDSSLPPLEMSPTCLSWSSRFWQTGSWGLWRTLPLMLDVTWTLTSDREPNLVCISCNDYYTINNSGRGQIFVIFEELTGETNMHVHVCAHQWYYHVHLWKFEDYKYLIPQLSRYIVLVAMRTRAL